VCVFGGGGGSTGLRENMLVCFTMEPSGMNHQLNGQGVASLV
jgi:hypothetical protein